MVSEPWTVTAVLASASGPRRAQKPNPAFRIDLKPTSLRPKPLTGTFDICSHPIGLAPVYINRVTLDDSPNSSSVTASRITSAAAGR